MRARSSSATTASNDDRSVPASRCSDAATSRWCRLRALRAAVNTASPSSALPNARSSPSVRSCA
jgi:hypothetical protein